MESPPLCLLFDNGSLRAASTLSLRRIAAALQARLGQPVRPVSLLHSSAVDPAELGGERAEILEPTLGRLAEAGRRRFLLAPLFFGPSGALTEYLPRRLERLRAVYPDLQVSVASPIVNPSDSRDERLARIVADGILKARAGRPADAAVLVDHGSPQPEVAAVRDHVGRQVERLLGKGAGRFAVASMERRPGPEYAFNEPLLSTLLGSPGFDRGSVTVALLFLSPGRHAGPGGDIETLCREAEARAPELTVTLTDLVGSDPRLIDILADRVREAEG